jgi:Na+-driven multidrug efflux pump
MMRTIPISRRLNALTRKKEQGHSWTLFAWCQAVFLFCCWVSLLLLPGAADAFTQPQPQPQHDTRILWLPTKPQLHNPSHQSAALRRILSRRRKCSSLAKHATVENTIGNDAADPNDDASSSSSPSKEDDQEEEGEEESGQGGFGVNERTLELSYLARTTSEYEKVNNGMNVELLVGAQHISLTSTDEIEPLLESSSFVAHGTNIVTTNETDDMTSSSQLTAKSVLKFLAPTLALWIAPPIMSLIDTSVVGTFCGATDLAALSPGCTVIDSSSYLFMFIATATTNLVASVRASKGAGNTIQESSDRLVSEALFLSLIAGSFLMILVLLTGRPLLSAIAGKESSAVIPSALSYATVRAFGQPAVVMASVARAAMLAGKDTRGPLLSVALAFGLNAVGTVTLVKYAHLGIVGAAIATLTADCAAAIFLLARIRHARKVHYEGENKLAPSSSSPPASAPLRLIMVPSLANFQKFCAYAAPIFFTILGKSVVYNGVAVSVGRMGAVALAAHQVLLGSFFFWTPIGDSVGMTSQVFLPGIIAEERQNGVQKGGAKRLLFATGVVAGLCAAALAGLLPSTGARLFTTDTAVAMALKQTAPILALSVALHAVALTCEGMLLAQRDLKFLSTSYVITTIATTVILLSPFRPATLGGSWWILALFQGGRAFQFALRNVWISRRRVVKDEPPYT